MSLLFDDKNEEIITEEKNTGKTSHGLLFDQQNVAKSTAVETSKLSKEEFVIQAIQELQNSYTQSIHSIYDGFNEKFKSVFDGEDPSRILNKMAQEGLITIKKAKAGVILSLTSSTPIKIKTPSKQDEQKPLDPNRHYDLNLQTPYNATILERRCGRLLQDARTAIEETGNNVLFLSIGFLEWYENDESDIPYKAPLILVPVELTKGKIDKENDCYTYKLIYTEEDIETNLSLAVKLSNDFGITLPDLDEQIEPQKYLDEVSDLIKHRKRWRIIPEMVIGKFSFAKIVMYKDLDPKKWPSDNSNIINNEKIQEVIVQGVKETFSDNDSVTYDNEHEIDGNERAEKIRLILDADSSQHSVIMDALDNKDLVVEGPPGTGKSQTIANLIAAALHDGKSVLFVAEKKAALEVVKRRLDKADLGDFCLELHSTKKQKGKLRDDIKKRIDRDLKSPKELKYFSEDLKRERDKLREYMNLISTVVGPSGEKIYEIIWKAERWSSELPEDERKNVFSLSNALSLTRSDIQDRITALGEFLSVFNEIPRSAVKTFDGFKPSNIFPGDENNLKTLLGDVLASSKDLMSLMDNVIAFVKGTVIEDSDNIQHVQILLSLFDQTLGVPEDIVINRHAAHLSPTAPQLLQKAKDVATATSNKIINFSTLFDISRLPGHVDLRQIASDLKQHSSSFFSFLSRKLRKVRRKICDFVTEEANVKDPQMASKLYEIADLLEKADSILNNSEYRKVLGPMFKGVDTEWERLEEQIAWSQSLRGLISSQSLAEKININISLCRDMSCKLRHKTENISSEADDSFVKLHFYTGTKLDDFLTKYDRLMNQMSSLGNIDEKVFFGQFNKYLEIPRIADKFHECLGQLDFLVLWNDYYRAKDKVVQLGLSEIVSAIENGSVAPQTGDALLKYVIYNSMTRQIVRDYPVLSSFPIASLENVRSRFAELDNKITGIVNEEIALKTSLRECPKGQGSGPVSTFTDMALIRHEINKQKRHIPTRQLVRRAGSALKALKPCFMMSPLSVAQYLVPGKMFFDLIVMDEASQIRPEDALGAFARGNRVVVVGDSKQLPPTNFYQRTSQNDGDDEAEAMAIQDMVSILDRCKTIYKSRRLRWHYRSEHESLISFSNREFYNEDLIIFPTPTRSDDQLGIRWHYEDATYLKSKNLIEAQAVTNAIIAHFMNTPQITLGVATFNREQRDLIEDLLDRKRKQDYWLDNIINEAEENDEPFFIKNLENVQGDERDVIFVSFTYGPDPVTRQVYQRFGPINSETGWRRLNVIFTRAKKRVEVFTSMLSTDIIINDKTSRGVRVLRSYLDYARDGKLHDYGAISNKEPDSDFEIAVAKELNSRGYKTAFQVGVSGFFIDIGVIHSQRESDFILGVECDGATYHSGKSVRDRDRLRQEILERRGWKIHRIWSTDWFRNRENEINKLVKKIKSLESEEVVVLKPAVKIETYKEPIFQTAETTSPVSKSDDNLRKELYDYRKANIDSRFADQSKGILRDEMLEAFVQNKPTSKEEFLASIPLGLRGNTSSQQAQFLEDIFQIIEEYI